MKQLGLVLLVAIGVACDETDEGGNDAQPPADAAIDLAADGVKPADASVDHPLPDLSLDVIADVLDDGDNNDSNDGNDSSGPTCAGVGCPGVALCNNSGQCVPPAYPASGREVGVDYHATGADFNDDGFLTRYHDATVRNTVKQQLADMATAGATVVSTRIWFVTAPGTTGAEPWKHHFPLSTQELDNIGLYAKDVAAAGLKLYLSTMYLWCAQYTEGAPDTTLGHCGLSAQEFVSRVKQSISGILQQVKTTYLPDGRPVVERFFLDGEVMTAVADDDPATQWEKKNQRWFLNDSGLWSWFHDEVKKAGLLPMIYLIHGTDENHILAPGFTDSYLPAINGHRSMYWIYRTLKFLQDNQLPIPDRIDFSCYPKATQTNPPTVINRVFADYAATIPNLLGVAQKDFFVAETFYTSQTHGRLQVHKGFAAQYALHPGFRGVTFWTTPYTEDAGGVMVGPPFAFDGLSDADIHQPLFANGDMETSDTCGSGDGQANPAGFCTEWSNGNVTTWTIGQSTAAAAQGQQGLALSFGACATSPCGGSAFPGVFVLSDQATGVVANQWAAVRLWGQYSGTDGAARALLLDGTDVASSVGFITSTAFVEYVLLGKLSSANLQLRFQIIDPMETNTELFVDALH